MASEACPSARRRRERAAALESARLSMPKNSRQLVEDASRGEAPAIDALLERYLPDLLRYVRRRAGPAILKKESGSDVVQSVCRELFENLRTERFEYRGEAEFKQWLYGAALLKLEGR